MKSIQIGVELHRDLAIASATTGQKINEITNRALRLEITRMNETVQEKTEKKKRVRKSDSLESNISNEGAQRGNSSRTRR